MKLFAFAWLALIPPSLLAGPQEIMASNIKWMRQFGSYSEEPHATFCLMAGGGLRAATKNLQTVTGDWLAKHPTAKVIPVSSMPFNTRDPQSRLIFVWVVDGDQSLNVELARQGCLDPATQRLGEGQALEVPQGDYDTFAKKLTAAGEYACEHKLGIWSRPQDDPEFPKDRELVTMFRSHREALEKLRTMALQNAGVVSYLTVSAIAGASSECSGSLKGILRLSEARRSEYVRLLSSIRDDLVIGTAFDRVSFSYWYGGLGLTVDRTWAKGIAYLPHGYEKVGRIVSSLDDLPTEDGVYLVPIEGSWYVIYVMG